MNVPGFTACGSLSHLLSHALSLLRPSRVSSGKRSLPDSGSIILWHALQSYSFISLLPASFLETFPRKSLFISFLNVLKYAIRSSISRSSFHGTFGMSVSFKREDGSLSQSTSRSSVLLTVTCVRSGPTVPPTLSIEWHTGQPLLLNISLPLSASPGP